MARKMSLGLAGMVTSANGVTGWRMTGNWGYFCMILARNSMWASGNLLVRTYLT